MDDLRWNNAASIVGYHRLLLGVYKLGILHKILLRWKAVTCSAWATKLESTIM